MMKKKFWGAAMACALALTAVMPVKAAGADVTSTANALSDYPDNYAEIYGVSYTVSPVDTTSGMYLAGIYVDNGSEANVTGGSVATFASTAMVGYAGSFGATPTAVDIEVGKTGTLTYLSKTPLFTQGATMAKTRLFAPGAGAVTVKGYTWLDQKGNKFVPTAKTNTDTTTDNSATTTNPSTEATTNTATTNTAATNTAATNTDQKTESTQTKTSPKTEDTTGVIPAAVLLVSSIGLAGILGYRKIKTNR